MDENEKRMLKEIHACLISGVDGKPGLLERVRLLESFKITFTRWFYVFIAGTVTNIGTFIFTLLLRLLSNE